MGTFLSDFWFLFGFFMLLLPPMSMTMSMFERKSRGQIELFPTTAHTSRMFRRDLCCLSALNTHKAHKFSHRPNGRLMRFHSQPSVVWPIGGKVLIYFT